MGYDTSKEMTNVSGSAHLKIWKHVMSQIHANLPNKDFTRPDGIVTMSVCAASGAQPSSLCSQDYYGYSARSDIAASDFKVDDSVCTLHKSYTVCAETGKLASANCPDTVDVVVAVKDGEILGKPSEIPEGKLDIDISQECTSEHVVVPETPEETTPGTEGEGTTTDPSAGTGNGSTETTTPTDPANDPNFGIQ